MPPKQDEKLKEHLVCNSVLGVVDSHSYMTGQSKHYSSSRTEIQERMTKLRHVDETHTGLQDNKIDVVRLVERIGSMTITQKEN